MNGERIEMSENQNVYTQNRTVSSAFIDSTVKLGIAQSALMIQDNLTECFEKLKCDGIVYRELGAFWVFTKTKIKFYKRPDWRTKIIASTFPLGNEGMRTQINSKITDSDGETLIVSNQEACVLNLETHRPMKINSLPFPKDNFPEPVYTEPFERFSVAKEDFKEIYTQVIRAQHIDMSHHMNNIEYIKLGLNVFTDEFLENHEPDMLEVHYTGESKEGQELHVMMAEKDNGYYINIVESSRTVFEMKIVFK